MKPIIYLAALLCSFFPASAFNSRHKNFKSMLGSEKRASHNPIPSQLFKKVKQHKSNSNTIHTQMIFE